MQDPLLDEGRKSKRASLLLETFSEEKIRKFSSYSSLSKSTANYEPSRTPSPKLSPRSDISGDIIKGQ